MRGGAHHVRIILDVVHAHVEELDVQVLVHRVQRAAHRQVVLQLDDDLLADERLEEGVEELRACGGGVRCARVGRDAGGGRRATRAAAAVFGAGGGRWATRRRGATIAASDAVFNGFNACGSSRELGDSTSTMVLGYPDTMVTP